jgi:triacylglycerol lipase
MTKLFRSALCAALAAVAGGASAQVPEPLYQGLLKIGQIVDPACTAILYRPLMPAADYNSWWPPGAAAPDPGKAKLYPGVTIVRDARFGPHPKDLVDIFMPDGGARNLPVFMWVPGGGGNKIEQQVREANAFYDNIGRWGAKNGFVTVLVQRHPGQAWDDPGRDIAAAVDWVKANIARHGGDGNRIVMGAHSAGTGPTGVYVGHPERWPNGVQIKGMIYMSGGPIPTILGGAPGPGNAPPPGAAPAGSACGRPGATPASAQGAISGPSGQTPPPPGAPAGPGGPGGPPPQLTPEQRAERDNLPGFLKTNVKVMLVRAELDPNVNGDMTPADKAIHDALCKSVGPNASDGEGRCPVMLYARRHSHMSEVFAFDTPDTSVSAPILAFAREALR